MIKVDVITMRYLELLHFEVSGFQTILTKIAMKSNELEDYTIDVEVREYYLSRYLELNKEYETLKSSIINEYVPKNQRHMLINFNFEKLCLEVTERGVCSC